MCNNINNNNNNKHNCALNMFFTFILDVVLRSHFYKYFHPKEALISNGIVNRLQLLINFEIFSSSCVPF